LVDIKGIEKLAPKDFPGHISATVFTGGCNFRCSFCHNADLVLRPDRLRVIPQGEFEAFLDSREGWLEAVCISGGEPLMHRGLASLLRIIKNRRLLVKVDTNGSYPNKIEDLIEKKLVDYWAMDIKGPLDKYSEICRVDVDSDAILRSMELIRCSRANYFFRTTVVPGLIREHDLEAIGSLLHKEDTFQLQQFSPLNTVDPVYLKKSPYPERRLQEMAEIMKKYAKEIRIEGISLWN
jgi:pyruvate formate lyase activating enzyme